MKYTVKMSCGHEETIALVGHHNERDRKIKFFETEGLCKECYRKKMEEEAEKEGLLFNATVLPRINEKNGSIVLNVWFSGNTKPYKDKIKALGGYSWGVRESADDFYSMRRPPLCWSKEIDFEELEEETIKAASIGAKSSLPDDGFFALAHYQIALKKQTEWKKTHEKIAEIQRPLMPTILKDRKWNYKIYGKSGKYTIYLDGEKITITDEQAEEIEQYIVDEREYYNKIKEIKNKMG